MEKENVIEVREIGGFVLVKDEDGYGLMDKQGNVLVPCVMEAFDFMYDLDCCIFEKEGLRGAYSKSMGYVSPVYDKIEIGADRIHVVLDGKAGYLDKGLSFVQDEAAAFADEKEGSLLSENLVSLISVKKRGAMYDSLMHTYVYSDDTEKIIVDEDCAYRIYMYGGHWKDNRDSI